MEGPAAKAADRPVADRAGKSHWLVTVSEGWEARSGTEATEEPSATVSRNRGAKIPDDRRLTDRAAGFYRVEGRGREVYPIDR